MSQLPMGGNTGPFMVPAASGSNVDSKKEWNQDSQSYQSNIAAGRTLKNSTQINMEETGAHKMNSEPNKVNFSTEDPNMIKVVLKKRVPRKKIRYSRAITTLNVPNLDTHDLKTQGDDDNIQKNVSCAYIYENIKDDVFERRQSNQSPENTSVPMDLEEDPECFQDEVFEIEMEELCVSHAEATTNEDIHKNAAQFKMPTERYSKDDEDKVSDKVTYTLATVLSSAHNESYEVNKSYVSKPVPKEKLNKQQTVTKDFTVKASQNISPIPATITDTQNSTKKRVSLKSRKTVKDLGVKHKLNAPPEFTYYTKNAWVPSVSGELARSEVRGAVPKGVAIIEKAKEKNNDSEECIFEMDIDDYEEDTNTYKVQEFCNKDNKQYCGLPSAGTSSSNCRQRSTDSFTTTGYEDMDVE